MHHENIVIFGDSYSTFCGYIPDGYAVYYPKETIPCVNDVSKTWWKMLATETESNILLNNSWSGSTICNWGYQGDCSKTSSFLFRLSQLIEDGFFSKNKVDRVLVFGATNDSWSENACGTPQFSDWTEKDLQLVLPGISFFIHTLTTVVEKEKIHFIVNTDLRPEIEKGIVEICRHYGVRYTLLQDIEKIGGHPTFVGMCAIKDQVLRSLN